MPDGNGLRTSHLSDAMDDLGVRGGAAGGFLYLGPPGTTAIGRAFTLRQALVRSLSGQSEPLARHGEVARELASPGDILVIDVSAHTGICTWGEAHTLRAMARGLAGVLINGATRDGAAIRKRQFPAACLGFSPVRSAGRLETVAIGEPVNIAAVRISQGDLVAIDDDGIVCVPAASADAVMKHAEDIVRREFERDRELEARLVR
jgi:4-hydroxy-4-methyl-2-oxoglutarate aldolase